MHPSFQHPLMGARLSLLMQALVKNGGVEMKHVGLITAMIASALVRAPFGWLEKIVECHYRNHAESLLDPVFIIGHWRSGTTHLHNLLAQSSALGIVTPLSAGLPDQMLTLAVWLKAWLERSLPENRYVDRVAVTPRSPQEDEIPLANQHLLSVFHAVYFPRDFANSFRRSVFFEGVSPQEVEQWACRLRRFLEKVSWHQQKPRILIKNPVYTARIAQLSRIFPGARFIHIRRNPYEVYASTRLYYTRLLSELALQSYAHVDLEQFIQSSYLSLMRKYDEDSTALPANRLIELSYEELASQPLDVLAKVHKQLSLPGWWENQGRVTKYLRSISDYRKNTLSLSTSELARVQQVWQPYIRRWSYDIPVSMQAGA